MAQSDDTNYYLAAFLNQYNLILLAFFVLASLVSFNPAPAVIGLGLEILYLAAIPETQFFKRYVASQKREAKQLAAASELEERIERLPAHQQHRYYQISSIIEKTETNVDEKGAQLGSHVIDQLEHLRERSLWMMELVTSYEHYLQNLEHGALQRDIEEVEERLESAEGRVRESLVSRLDILHKRRERLERVREYRSVVGTQLETVEDMLRLIYESSMTMQNPSDVSDQIEHLMIDVEATEETVLELDDVEGGMTLEDFDEELAAAEQEQQAKHYVQ